ncbi:PIN-like domain-containing protein [Streptomyces dioscori]|uniref:PIN-like domain-containing protein n=1 Tax=Streptomyces dioscori TaxID=2109333 RepID=UPI001CEDA462|nr:toxin-antitoxin system, toxin component, PIN family protein [Streptomyces dioscori]
MPPEFFLDRSWIPLSKDGRIKTRDLEIRPVLEREAVLFYLDNQQLPSAEMVQRLVVSRDAIHRAVEKGGPAAYAVRHDRIERTWP